MQNQVLIFLVMLKVNQVQIRFCSCVADEGGRLSAVDEVINLCKQQNQKDAHWMQIFLSLFSRFIGKRKIPIDTILDKHFLWAKLA